MPSEKAGGHSTIFWCVNTLALNLATGFLSINVSGSCAYRSFRALQLMRKWCARRSAQLMRFGICGNRQTVHMALQSALKIGKLTGSKSSASSTPLKEQSNAAWKATRPDSPSQCIVDRDLCNSVVFQKKPSLTNSFRENPGRILRVMRGPRSLKPPPIGANFSMAVRGY